MGRTTTKKQGTAAAAAGAPLSFRPIGNIPTSEDDKNGPGTLASSDPIKRRRSGSPLKFLKKSLARSCSPMDRRVKAIQAAGAVSASGRKLVGTKPTTTTATVLAAPEYARRSHDVDDEMDDELLSQQIQQPHQHTNITSSIPEETEEEDRSMSENGSHAEPLGIHQSPFLTSTTTQESSVTSDAMSQITYPTMQDDDNDDDTIELDPAVLMELQKHRSSETAAFRSFATDEYGHNPINKVQSVVEYSRDDSMEISNRHLSTSSNVLERAWSRQRRGGNVRRRTEGGGVGDEKKETDRDEMLAPAATTVKDDSEGYNYLHDNPAATSPSVLERAWSKLNDESGPEGEAAAAPLTAAGHFHPSRTILVKNNKSNKSRRKSKGKQQQQQPQTVASEQPFRYPFLTSTSSHSQNSQSVVTASSTSQPTETESLEHSSATTSIGILEESNSMCITSEEEGENGLVPPPATTRTATNYEEKEEIPSASEESWANDCVGAGDGTVDPMMQRALVSKRNITTTQEPNVMMMMEHTSESSRKNGSHDKKKKQRKSRGNSGNEVIWSKTRTTPTSSGSKQLRPDTTPPPSYLYEAAMFDEPPCKIFLLLLEPKTKVFELIQLIYPPSTTTVGDILVMIPQNATEPALADQLYKGLIRPKSHAKSWTDKKLLASSSSANTEHETAGIDMGEILIAIPYEYATKYVSRLGRQILSNRRIQTLMESATALESSMQQAAPPRRSRSSSSSASKSRHQQQQRRRSTEGDKSDDPDTGGSSSKKNFLCLPVPEEAESKANKDPLLGNIYQSAPATLSSIAEAAGSTHTMSSSPSSQTPGESTDASTPPARTPDSGYVSMVTAEQSLTANDGHKEGLAYGRAPAPFVEQKITQLEQKFRQDSSFDSATSSSEEDVQSPATAQWEADLLAKRQRDAQRKREVEVKDGNNKQSVGSAGSATPKSSRPTLGEYFQRDNSSPATPAAIRALGPDRSATAGVLPQGRYLDRSKVGVNNNSDAASVHSSTSTTYSVRSLPTTYSVRSAPLATDSVNGSVHTRDKRTDHIPIFRHRTIGGRFDDDNVSIDNTSLDHSISSWSRSVDSSLAHRVGHTATPREPSAAPLLYQPQVSFRAARRQKQKKAARQMRRFVAAGLALMVIMYAFDSSSSSATSKHDGGTAATTQMPTVASVTLQQSPEYARAEPVDELPLGFAGLLQAILVFVSLLKFQKFVRRGKGEESNCPFLQGCSLYLDGLRQKSPAPAVTSK